MENLIQELTKLYKPNDPLPKRRKRFQRFAKENASPNLLRASLKLSESRRKKYQEIAAHILIPKVYFLDPKFAQSIIINLAKSDNWEIREEAATILKGLNKKHFKDMVPVYKKWIRSNNSLTQRAIAVSLFGVKDNFDLACKITAPILKNPDRYVRINLGPFGLAWLYYKDKRTVQKHIKKWIKSGDENVLWNIVMIFSQARGKHEPNNALEMVKKIGNVSSSDLVIRGCASVIYNVAKYHPKIVQEFVNRNRDQKWFGKILQKSKTNLAKKGIR